MNRLNRRVAARELLKERGELIVVAGLGSPAYDLAASGNEPREFPTWGAMGGAVMIGLGLALAQPAHNVLVLTGDGEMLMGLGSLATVALQNPPNLRIVVMDNGLFGETGGQPTHVGVTDLAAVAHACGIKNTRTVYEMSNVPALRSDVHTYDGTLFAVLKISNEEVPRVLPPRDGPFLTNRFRRELLGAEAALDA